MLLSSMPPFREAGCMRRISHGRRGGGVGGSRQVATAWSSSFRAYGSSPCSYDGKIAASNGWFLWFSRQLHFLQFKPWSSLLCYLMERREKIICFAHCGATQGHHVFWLCGAKIKSIRKVSPVHLWCWKPISELLCTRHAMHRGATSSAPVVIGLVI